MLFFKKTSSDDNEKENFFAEGYLFLYPDVKKAKIDPWVHYQRYGKAENRLNGSTPPAYFNKDEYYKLNTDVAASGMDAWRHYVLYGHKEGRRISERGELSDLPKELQGEIFRPTLKPIEVCDWRSVVHFSIIMPTYNRAMGMLKSVECVLQQTYRHFELIIADDGSTDDTEAVIHSRYRKEIEQGIIRYIKCPHRGVCATRNAALEAARYSWIAYVDSDNYPRPDFLQTFAEAIEQNPDKNVFYAKARLIQTDMELGKPFDFQSMLRLNYIDLGMFVHNVAMYRRYGGFDGKLRRLVDWDLIIRYTQNETPLFIDKVVFDYCNATERADRITVSVKLGDAMSYVRQKHRIKNVTTCITAYNHEKYLRNAIESALMQTGRINHKIVIFDDQSTDGTQKIGEEYAAKYPDKVRYVRNQTNLGMARNMKQCFRTIDTDFIAILEGDDYWIDEYRLHKMCTFLDTNPDCSMCFNATLIYGEKSLRFRGLKRQTILPEKLDGDDILNSHAQNPFANFSSCVYWKDVVQTLPDCLYEGIVTEMAVGLHAQRYGKVGFINEKMSVYRQHPGGLWSGKDPRRAMEYRIKARETMLEVAPDVYKPAIQRIINKFQLELERLK